MMKMIFSKPKGLSEHKDLRIRQNLRDRYKEPLTVGKETVPGGGGLEMLTRRYTLH